MMTPRDLNIFSIAAGSAALLGIGFGVWAAPQANIGAASADPPPAAAIDPNLARYQQMLAEEGVDPTPPVTLAAFYPPPQAVTPPAEQASDPEPAFETVSTDAARTDADETDVRDAFGPSAPPPVPMPMRSAQAEPAAPQTAAAPTVHLQVPVQAAGDERAQPIEVPPPPSDGYLGPESRGYLTRGG